MHSPSTLLGNNGSPLPKWAGWAGLPHLLNVQAESMPYQGHPFSPDLFLLPLSAYHGGPRQSLQLSGWAQEGVTGAASCSGVGEGPVLGQLDRWGRAWVFTGICPREGRGEWMHLPSSKDSFGDVLPPAGTLTIRTGLMASVA